ncbi:MAG: multiheme c-type cytochrome [Myxococcota bacterium]
MDSRSETRSQRGVSHDQGQRRPKIGAVLLAIVIAIGCGNTEEASAPTTTAPGSEAAPEAASVEPAKSGGKQRVQRKEQPLPAISGFALDGQRIQIGDFLGKRVALYFFDPGARDADAISTAVSRVAALGAEYNFAVVGIAFGADRPTAEAHVAKNNLDFPVIDDASGRISRRFGLREAAMLGVDGDGYVTWASRFSTNMPNPSDHIEGQLRTALRIPEAAPESFGSRPEAPTFTAKQLDEEAPFDFATTRGEAVVLIFFLHTCPHCHEALEFFKTALAGLPEDQRPLLYGVETSRSTAGAIRNRLDADGLDYFPVLRDKDRVVQSAYGVFGGVPDIFLIDRKGRIVSRSSGWNAAEGPLLRMRMAQMAGAPVPMLLHATGYSGSEVCGVCHQSEHQTWQLTQHATAFDTLVTHGSAADPECVGCHVVGFGEAGGFEISPPKPTLEDVGCESCHGRGGPHLSPSFITDANYDPVCVTCHDTKHSLGFEYASFLPKVSHAANAHILTLPAAEREKILAERGGLRANVLPTNAEYVGSEACRSCHEAEFATWAAGPHAASLASLETKGESTNPDCLRCHTTAFDRKGGFPASASVGDHPDLARVGCESCHGPGGNHVAESSVKLGSIVSLGDKCDSCVILQICGGCHDDANDPGFEFEVQAKIDKIRHATIEAGTGKPLQGKSALRVPTIDTHALLARAFEAHDRATGRP